MGRRLRIGEDILLARHGGNIRSLSYDRRTNSMVAVLSDGSRDAASNVIATTPVRRSGDFATVIAPPHTQSDGSDGAQAKPVLDAEDKKILAWTGAIGVGLSIALAIAVTAAGSALGDDALQQMAMTVPAF